MPIRESRRICTLLGIAFRSRQIPLNEIVRVPENPLPVEEWSCESPVSVRVRTPFTQKGAAIHRGFSLPCASRGKGSPRRVAFLPLFQSSCFAQPRFRKLGCTSNTSMPDTFPSFPLFLSELRRLLVLFFLITLFSHTRRPLCIPDRIRTDRHRICQASGTSTLVTLPGR